MNDEEILFRKMDRIVELEDELAECREELAAAGAQLLAAKEAVDWLWGYWDGNTLIPHRHDASLQAEIQEAFEACIDATVLGDHAALDAALEQARRYFIRALGGLCQAQGFAKISIHWDGTGGYGPFYGVGASGSSTRITPEHCNCERPSAEILSWTPMSRTKN